MSRRVSPKPLSEATRARARAHRQVAPPPPGNTRAIRTGAQADGRNLATYGETVAEIESLVADAAWIAVTDAPAVELFARELCVYRHASTVLAQMSGTGLMKKHKAQGVQVKRLRALNEMARDLGLSPAGRFKLGLTSARTERELQHVRPVRSEARALEVGAILAAAGALPNRFRVIDAEEVEQPPEPVAETTPDETSAAGEVVPLRVAEGEQ